MNKCKNCGKEFESAFCPNCGTASNDSLAKSIQNEVQQNGISAVYEKYCVQNRKQYKLAKTFYMLLTFVCMGSMLAIAFMNVDFFKLNLFFGFSIVILILGIIAGIGGSIAGIFCSPNRVYRSKINLLLNNNIDVKKLLVESYSKFREENSEIAYYVVNEDKRRKRTKNPILSTIFSMIFLVVLMIAFYFFFSIYMVFINLIKGGYIWIVLIILGLIILLAFLPMIIINVHKKKVRNRINEWAEQYVSANNSTGTPSNN